MTTLLDTRTVAPSDRPEYWSAGIADHFFPIHVESVAGDCWQDWDLVWCQQNGYPIDTHVDWEEWKEILGQAGIKDVRLHDARHTAGTLLERRGVASDATPRTWPEDGAVRDGGATTARRRSRRQNEHAGQDAVQGQRCVRCEDVASTLVA